MDRKRKISRRGLSIPRKKIFLSSHLGGKRKSFSSKKRSSSSGPSLRKDSQGGEKGAFLRRGGILFLEGSLRTSEKGS